MDRAYRLLDIQYLTISSTQGSHQGRQKTETGLEMKCKRVACIFLIEFSDDPWNGLNYKLRLRQSPDTETHITVYMFLTENILGPTNVVDPP